MGGSAFATIGKGKNASEAFSAAVKKARYDHGHAGYSGTLAEKGEFVEIPRPPGDRQAVLAYADKLTDEGDPRIDDKWGPAGCIEIEAGVFLFFGWASS